MKQVLYLSYTGMTEPLGRSQVLAYLAGLAATGKYRFTLVSFEKHDSFEQNRAGIQEFCDEHHIAWYPLSYTKRPPVVSTFRDVARMRRLALRLHRQRPFHLVHCRSYIPALNGLWLKRRYKVPFLFDMRGFWADERVDGGIWKLGNPLYRTIYNFFKNKEKQFLKEADYVVSLTDNAKQDIEHRGLRPRNLPVQVIPCCVDLELFDPQKISEKDQAAVRKAWSIPEDAFVLSYLGTLGTWYLLDEMLWFFKALLAQRPGSIFLFVTREPREMILEAAAAVGLPEESLRIGPAARNEVPLMLSLSACSIFFIKPSFSKKASSPVKQGEIMAMGVPVVCNDGVGDTAMVVEQFRAGIVVPHMRKEEIANAAKQVLTATFEPEKIRAGARSFYALEEGVRAYRSIYENIIK